MEYLKVKLLEKMAKMPTKSYNSAGIDVYALGDHVLSVGETKIIPTGIACELADNCVALVWDRGSMGAKGIHRFAGVIDGDYRGQWGIMLHNFGVVSYMIKHGDKIAQVIIQKYESPIIMEVAELGTTERGGLALGSSDRGTTEIEAQTKMKGGISLK